MTSARAMAEMALGRCRLGEAMVDPEEQDPCHDTQQLGLAMRSRSASHYGGNEAALPGLIAPVERLLPHG